MDLNYIKSELKALGAKTTGSKAILERRLALWKEKQLNKSLITANVIPVDAEIFPDHPFQPLSTFSGKKILDFQAIEVWFQKRMAKKGMLKGRILAMKLFTKYTQVFEEGNKIYVKAHCSAEQRKTAEYEVRIILITNPVAIKQCNCTCPAGTSWSAACKHVGAVCFSLEYFTLTGTVQEYVSCTSLPLTWNKPKGSKGREVQPMSIYEMLDIEKEHYIADAEYTAATINGLINYNIDCPLTYCRKTTSDDVANDHDYAATTNERNHVIDNTDVEVIEMDHSYCAFSRKENDVNIGASTSKDANENVWKMCDRLYSLIFSLLDVSVYIFVFYLIEKKNEQNIVLFCLNQGLSIRYIIFLINFVGVSFCVFVVFRIDWTSIDKIIENSKNSAIAKNLYKAIKYPLRKCCLDLFETVIVCKNILQICIDTKLDYKKWEEERRYRITGSRCYSLFTYKGSDWEMKSCKYFWPKKFTSKYTNHGLIYEQEARKIYCENLQEEVIECGLVICEKNPFLAYSPDGIIFKQGIPAKLLEIKCPYKGREGTATDLIGKLDYLKSENGSLVLNTKHMYYSQVQMGMAVLNLKECDFIIFASLDKTFLKISVSLDIEFATNLVETLKNIYFDNMLHSACVNSVV